MNVAILLYEGFDELDAVGPFEVFNSVDGCSASLVTLEAQSVVTASHGLRVETDGVLEDADCDLLLVPGGGWSDRSSPGAWTAYEDGTIPKMVAEYHDRGVTVASVCTGGMLFAKAGVLDGRPASTHHTALDDLRETKAIVREERVVDDGDVLTCGGVTSGIDLALHLIEREFGADTADVAARRLEYERRAF